MPMNEFTGNIQNQIWLMVIISFLTGYLPGSISFARIVYFYVTNTTRIEPFAEPIPHSNEIFESNLVSATLVTKKLGAKYGCITSLFDMLKVALPTLAMRMVFPDQPWFLLTAFSGVLAHNYSVWYRFSGGRGESPILGSLFIMNWFGIFIANLAGTFLGFITGSVLVVRWSGYIILIFWFWIYFNDVRYVLFMIMVNFLFWFSLRRDLAKFRELKKKKGLSFSEEDVSEFILMGRGLGRFLDKYSLYVLLRKAFKSKV